MWSSAPVSRCSSKFCPWTAGYGRLPTIPCKIRPLRNRRALNGRAHGGFFEGHRPLRFGIGGTADHCGNGVAVAGESAPNGPVFGIRRRGDAIVAGEGASQHAARFRRSSSVRGLAAVFSPSVLVDFQCTCRISSRRDRNTGQGMTEMHVRNRRGARDAAGGGEREHRDCSLGAN